jgi:hypothetical protein
MPEAVEPARRHNLAVFRGEPMPDVVAQRINGGWITITPGYVIIEDDNKEEVVYWDETEWNTPGNAEAAQAALNAIGLALTEGVGAVRQRIEEGKR